MGKALSGELSCPCDSLFIRPFEKRSYYVIPLGIRPSVRLSVRPSVRL